MIDLKPFCGRNDPREYLNQPWHENGATFATNGHIGIQLNEVLPGVVPVHTRMMGQLEKHLTESCANNTALEIKFPDEPPKTCGHCGGSGYVIAKACDECEGDGWFEHGSHNYDCKECKAQGEIHSPASRSDADAEACWVCDGSGSVSRHIHLKANGVTYGFHEKYLRLIAGLPSARLLVSADNQKAAHFDFDGGMGVLMPLRF